MSISLTSQREITPNAPALRENGINAKIDVF
jgi:hypothetical protein